MRCYNNRDHGGSFFWYNLGGAIRPMKEDAGNSSNSFVFTTAGKFLEDGIFPGDYIVEDDTFTLQYQANFEDTRCWFVQDGDTMTVEYPWPVIPVD